MVDVVGSPRLTASSVSSRYGPFSVDSRASRRMRGGTTAEPTARMPSAAVIGPMIPRGCRASCCCSSHRALVNRLMASTSTSSAETSGGSARRWRSRRPASSAWSRVNLAMRQTSVRWKFWNDRDAVGPRCPW